MNALGNVSAITILASTLACNGPAVADPRHGDDPNIHRVGIVSALGRHCRRHSVCRRWLGDKLRGLGMETLADSLEALGDEPLIECSPDQLEAIGRLQKWIEESAGSNQNEAPKQALEKDLKVLLENRCTNAT